MTAPHNAQEATNPSDTPRTDAEEYELHHTFAGGSMRPCRDGGWVDADFARKLERELAQARTNGTELWEMSQHLARELAQLREERDGLRKFIEGVLQDSDRVLLPPSWKDAARDLLNGAETEGKP